MALIISLISQKGGVGKSTIARLVAREYAANGYATLIADLDTNQSTCVNWNKRRLLDGTKPELDVQQFGTVEKALRLADKYDLIVFDGAPHASKQTLEVAQKSDLVIIPTGTALDDLEPTRDLGRELTKAGIPQQKILVVLNHVGGSEAEINEAREYLRAKDMIVLDTALPERTSYRRASDDGKAITETTHPATNKKADELAQNIMDKI